MAWDSLTPTPNPIENMKIKFKFYGAEKEIWASRDNILGENIINQPNKSKLQFISIDGSIKVDITVDERHRLTEQLAMGMQNEIFEFDFAQPMPANRLNP